MKQITLIAAILLSADLIKEAYSIYTFYSSIDTYTEYYSMMGRMDMAFNAINFLSQAAVTVFFIVLYKNQK